MSEEKPEKNTLKSLLFSGWVKKLYLDLVITLNVAVNFLLLKITGQIARQKTTFFRLLLGSALGGIILLLIVFPTGFSLLLSWPGKLLLPVAMIILAYRPRRWKDALLLLLLFYLCSFILAGLVIAFLLWNNYSLAHSLDIYFLCSPSLFHLFGAGIFLFIFVRWVSPLLEEKFKYYSLGKDYQVQVSLFGKKKKISAFLDTGNMLKEPFSGLPVAVVSYAAIAELLPPEICAVLEEGPQIEWGRLEKALGGCGAELKFRLVPYSSLNHDDYMIAFRPEEITIWQKGKEIALKGGLIIAIAQQNFNCGEEYEMLLPLDICSCSSREEGR